MSSYKLVEGEALYPIQVSLPNFTLISESWCRLIKSKHSPEGFNNVTSTSCLPSPWINGDESIKLLSHPCGSGYKDINRGPLSLMFNLEVMVNRDSLLPYNWIKVLKPLPSTCSGSRAWRELEWDFILLCLS